MSIPLRTAYTAPVQSCTSSNVGIGSNAIVDLKLPGNLKEPRDRQGSKLLTNERMFSTHQLRTQDPLPNMNRLSSNQRTETLSSRGQEAIRSELLDSLGIARTMKPSASQDSFGKAMEARTLTSTIPQRFQSRNYKWELSFSSARNHSVLSNDEVAKLSLNGTNNFRWEQHR
ncbi:unnamed protein product [Pseudo-nitzschia multistriata]|uniref:Uncharacterized protein n=1 Tax=Pseudo-nitzschia multistriata TaxID=183589 RepID=A0A448YWL6_9STRA|nr:unnamed protein product [Pseudo-nitzschia multistriata]